MGLKRVFFGSDHPTPHQVTVSIVFTFIAGVGFYGMVFADFVPTDWWSTLGLRVAIAAAIAFGIYLLYAQQIGGLPTKLRVSMSKRRLAVPLVQLLIFPFYWTAVCYGIPDIIALSTGEHESRTALVTTSKSTYRRTRALCPVKVRGDTMANAIMGRLCVDGSTPIFSLSPVEVTLRGRSTTFGFHVSDISNFRPINPEDTS